MSGFQNGDVIIKPNIIHPSFNHINKYPSTEDTADLNVKHFKHNVITTKPIKMTFQQSLHVHVLEQNVYQTQFDLEYSSSKCELPTTATRAHAQSVEYRPV